MSKYLKKYSSVNLVAVGFFAVVGALYGNSPQPGDDYVSATETDAQNNTGEFLWTTDGNLVMLLETKAPDWGVLSTQALNLGGPGQYVSGARDASMTLGTAASSRNGSIASSFGDGDAAFAFANYNSLAFGTWAYASNNSLALGGDARSTGGGSIALDDAKAFGIASIAMGNWSVRANGDGSIVSGGESAWAAKNSIAMGTGATTHGWSSGAIGRIASARAQSSVALGEKVVAYAPQSVVVGIRNTGLRSDGVTQPVATEEHPGDPIFQVGNGTNGTPLQPSVSGGTTSDAFTVYRDGTVRLGSIQGDISMGPFGSQ